MTSLQRQRFSLSGLGLAVLLTISHATNDAFASILPVFLPSIQANFQLGEGVLALFVAVISFSSNVLQPFMGAVSDRVGRRRAAALGLMTGSLLMSLIAVVPSLWMLVLILVAGGLGSSIFHPSAVSMARAVGTRKGLVVGFFTSGGPLGAAIAPIVVLAVMRNYGVQVVPYLSIVGVVIAVILFVLTPEQTVVARSAQKIFDLSLMKGPIGLLALAGILRSLAFISFSNAMPLWLVNIKGYATDAGIIGWTLAAFSAAAALGVLLSGSLEQRLGRQLLVTGSMLLAFPALLAIFVVPTGSWLFFSLVIVGGLLTNAAIPLMVVSAQDLAPDSVAAASGMLMGFTWGTAGVLYIGLGQLQQLIGITAAMMFSFIFVIPAAFLALYVLKKHQLN